MTLGIAASKSVKKASGIRRGRGQKSTTKMAAKTPMGMAKTMANAEVYNVPKMAGATPKVLCTGSNAEFVKKLKPKALMVGHE